MITALYIIFSDTPGQVTPYSVMGPGRNANQFKSILLLLSARMKKIQNNRVVTPLYFNFSDA